jgi:hypothetical protein
VNYRGVSFQTPDADGGAAARPVCASLISYLIVLFPALDVLSAFPLHAITLGRLGFG